jgi:ubiquinone/menaquinone biosynthesis C-methylase UbiE
MTNRNSIEQKRIVLDGRNYHVDVQRQVVQPPEAPRLIIVSYLPNPTACDVLRVCIQSIQHYTPEPHEVWVIDNHSPRKHLAWLRNWPGINVGFSRTSPVPPEARGGLWRSYRNTAAQLAWGSYANATALELAVRLIDPHTHYVMTLHMDTMPCREGWLSYLQSHLDGNTAAAGARMDRIRTSQGVLHVLGYIVDFQLFQHLELDFWPKLPQYDVGDQVTVRLREAGYKVFACPNTLWEPQRIETIPDSSPLRSLHVDRSFDSKGNVIFLHLGRGVKKSSGQHETGITPEEWVRFAEAYLLEPARLPTDVVSIQVRNLSYSLRRYFVDEFHFRHIPTLPAGSKVLDLGGTKLRKRGQFDIERYNLEVVYANLSRDKHPDIQANAALVPLQAEWFDAVICSELLEHVPDPHAVVREAWRVLRPGGTLFITAPFLFHIHGDPYDYGRYTDHYWREVLHEAGFSHIVIESQGLFFSVMVGCAKYYLYKMDLPRPYRRLAHWLMPHVQQWAMQHEQRHEVREHPFVRSFTTGFGVVAVKRG